MEAKKINLTREELYELVWSKPAIELARELGISDVAIGKICKKLNIPKPPLGYWRKVEAGSRIKPPALPAIRPGVKPSIIIHPTAKPSLQSQSPEVLSLRESESQISNRIVVADSLRNTHHLVTQIKAVLEKDKPDIYGSIGIWLEQTGLKIRISKNTLHRSLCILDALFKALAARGYLIETSEGRKSFTKSLLKANL